MNNLTSVSSFSSARLLDYRHRQHYSSHSAVMFTANNKAASSSEKKMSRKVWPLLLTGIVALFNSSVLPSRNLKADTTLNSLQTLAADQTTTEEVSPEKKAFYKAQNNFWAVDLEYNTKGVEPFLRKLGDLFNKKLTTVKLEPYKNNFNSILNQIDKIRQEMDKKGLTPEFIRNHQETPFPEEQYGKLIDIYKKTVSSAVDFQYVLLESIVPTLMLNQDYIAAQDEFDKDVEPLLKEYDATFKALQQAKEALK